MKSKKILACIISLTMVFGGGVISLNKAGINTLITASAVTPGDYTSGDFTVSVSEDQEITITGLKNKIDKIDSIPSSIAKLPVVKVSMSYESFSEITIPDSVREVRIHDCEKLNKINMTGTVKELVINSCNSIDSLDVPYGVEKLHVSECEKLTDLKIPTSVSVLGRLNDNPALKKIIIPAGITELGTEDTYDYRAREFFSGCTSLEEVKFTALKEIPKDAFKGCSALKKVDLCNTTTNISESAFEDCTSLESIYLPDTLKEIGDSAFRGCTKLSNVRMPEISLTSIGSYAFFNCPALKELTLPVTVTNVGNYTFGKYKDIDDNQYKAYNDFELKLYAQTAENVGNLGDTFYTVLDKEEFQCTYYDDTVTITGYNWNKAKLVIPEKIKGKTVTAIDKEAFGGLFKYNQAMQTITLPETLREIGSQAFIYCDFVGEIEIPEDCYVGFDAFYGSNFTKVVMNKGTRIADGAFATSDKTVKDIVILSSKISGEDIEDAFKDGFSSEVKFESDPLLTCNYFRNTKLGEWAEEKDIRYKYLNLIGDFAYYDKTDENGDPVRDIAYTGKSDTITVPLTLGGVKVDDYDLGDNVKNVIYSSGYTSASLNYSSVTIPKTVTRLTGTFSPYSENGKIDLYFTDDVTAVPDDLFNDAFGLSYNEHINVHLPKKLTDIGANSLSNITGDNDMTIPDTVTHIGQCAFENTKFNDSIKLPSSLKTIDAWAFNLAFYGETINIPDGVTTIGDFAFINNPGVKKVIVPASVTSIGKKAFGYSLYYQGKGGLYDYAKYRYYKDFKNSEHYTEEFKEEKLAIDLYCKKGSAAEKYAKDNGFRLITENDGGYMVYASYPEDKPIDKPNNMPDDKPNDRPLDIIPTDSETTDSETTDSKTTSDENPMKGDANGDNEINVTDIAVTAAHIKGIKALTDVQKQAADVNGDEQVNVTDIAMIAAHIKGIKAIG